MFTIYAVYRRYTMPRKMISVDEKDYRKLVKAKGKLETETGRDLSLGEAIGWIALGALAGYGLVKLAQELSKDKEGQK
jgi:hypothetical protein